MAETSLEPDDVIDGKYRIVRLLGKGGMGWVFEGDNELIHRRVAIKVLRASMAGNQTAARRFRKEAQAAGRIGSKHIVEVLDLGELESGEPYMVLEYLDGVTLKERFKSKGTLSPEEAIALLLQLLDGLGKAHEAGIVHRDLKPDNVFIIKDEAGNDFIKILDFGVSKFRTIDPNSMEVTKSGVIMGTPYYMSPEQIEATKNVDQRADIYAVGVLLYEALSGRVPYSADSLHDLLMKILTHKAIPIDTVSDIDAGLATIVGKAMSRKLEERFQTADEFAAALTNWTATPSAPAAKLETKGGGTVPLPPEFDWRAAEKVADARQHQKLQATAMLEDVVAAPIATPAPRAVPEPTPSQESFDDTAPPVAPTIAEMPLPALPTSTRWPVAAMLAAVALGAAVGLWVMLRDTENEPARNAVTTAAPSTGDAIAVASPGAALSATPEETQPEQPQPTAKTPRADPREAKPPPAESTDPIEPAPEPTPEATIVEPPPPPATESSSRKFRRTLE